MHKVNIFVVASLMTLAVGACDGKPEDPNWGPNGLCVRVTEKISQGTLAVSKLESFCKCFGKQVVYLEKQQPGTADIILQRFRRADAQGINPRRASYLMKSNVTDMFAKHCRRLHL